MEPHIIISNNRMYTLSAVQHIYIAASFESEFFNGGLHGNIILMGIYADIIHLMEADIQKHCP